MSYLDEWKVRYPKEVKEVTKVGHMEFTAPLLVREQKSGMIFYIGFDDVTIMIARAKNQDFSQFYAMINKKAAHHLVGYVAPTPAEPPVAEGEINELGEPPVTPVDTQVPGISAAAADLADEAAPSEGV